MSRLRVALLGCGFAARLHSRTLRRFDDVDRFYASRDGRRAAEYAGRFGGAGHFDSYDAALADPDVDIVLIGTPPATHLELTRAALAAGKHVIVEKPPFLSSDDFAEVERLAAAADRGVLVAENYYYKPLLDRLRRYLAGGVIGDVRIVSVNALKRQRTGDWRDEAGLAGGGAFFEGGIHWVSFMASLGLDVRAARGFRPGPDDGPDRSMVAVFDYQGGAVGTLYYSWEIGSPMRGLRLSSIHGTEGAITFESNGLFLAVRGRRLALSVPRPTDLLGYTAMFTDFFRAIRTGAPARYDLDLARRDLRLVESIYRTAGRTTSTTHAGGAAP